ncbi:hypothetical protein HAZT_HAZT009538 [Hyalella azteca]|uniref:Galactosylgalactosylxylosylprotein 3-beta-glucuronosyltransferase n=1 Tax=Hyalella azteca TaxID=294128 RepID=A0A6A0GTH0_HYAAZ|nr:hypothetical protein HAZT_HAZT009538 [Hyalella azteca]
MRYTQRVSMWPVGLVTGLALSTPVLKDGHLVGWYDGFIYGRKFPVDMAGFAVNVDYWRAVSEVEMPFKTSYEEDGFLRAIGISFSELEFKANDCTEIYVWHTRTSKAPKAKRTIFEPAFDDSNIRILQNSMLIEPLTEANANKNYSSEVSKMMTLKTS